MASKLPLLTTCALLALPLSARAESNPRAVTLRIQCQADEAAPKHDDKESLCKSLGGWFEGRLDWRSGGTVGNADSGSLLFSELGRFYAMKSTNGEVLIYADGNGIPEDFEQRYLTPGPHNVLTAPDLRVVLYLRVRHDYVPLADQRFMPVASAAWARHAEEALRFRGELKGDVTGTQQATRVVAIQNVPVSNTAPAAGQEWRFDGSQWVPTTTSPLTAGAGLQGGSYNGQAPATFSVVFGTGPGTVTEGSDARLPPAPGAAGQLLYSNGSSWSALPPGGPARPRPGRRAPRPRPSCPPGGAFGSMSGWRGRPHSGSGASSASNRSGWRSSPAS